MIRDEIIFSKDYHLLHKKCFSCERYSHMIEECPKLHYIPNKERIIKSLNYSKFQERKFVLRSNKKKFNALLTKKKNSEISKNTFKLLLQQCKAATEISDQSSATEDDDEDYENISVELHSEKNEELCVELKDNDNDNNNLSFGGLVGGQFSSEILINIKGESKKEINKSPTIENLKSPTSKKVEFHKESKENMNMSEIKIKKGEKEDNNFHTQINSFVLKDSLDGYDTVKNFKKYFPNSNIERILKNQNSIKMMERGILKKYLAKNYKKMKNYSFYTNEILEKFWKEKKIKKRNTNIEKILKKEDPKKKRTSRLVASLNSLNPGKKDYFSSDSKELNKISSFGNLVQKIIDRKKERKKDSTTT